MLFLDKNHWSIPWIWLNPIKNPSGISSLSHLWITMVIPIPGCRTIPKGTSWNHETRCVHTNKMCVYIYSTYIYIHIYSVNCFLGLQYCLRIYLHVYIYIYLCAWKCDAEELFGGSWKFFTLRNLTTPPCGVGRWRQFRSPASRRHGGNYPHVIYRYPYAKWPVCTADDGKRLKRVLFHCFFLGYQRVPVQCLRKR